MSASSATTKALFFLAFPSDGADDSGDGYNPDAHCDILAVLAAPTDRAAAKILVDEWVFDDAGPLATAYDVARFFRAMAVLPRRQRRPAAVQWRSAWTEREREKWLRVRRLLVRAVVALRPFDESEAEGLGEALGELDIRYGVAKGRVGPAGAGPQAD